jgi:hypothetical protein
MRKLTTENVFDDGRLIGFGFVGFAIGAANLTEVIQHDMDGDISRGASGVWLRTTLLQFDIGLTLRLYRQRLVAFSLLRQVASGCADVRCHL